MQDLHKMKIFESFLHVIRFSVTTGAGMNATKMRERAGRRLFCFRFLLTCDGTCSYTSVRKEEYQGGLHVLSSAK
ncbi:MAG: hypothetical protein C0394_02015 [Syntrophus sp. (in: bacteria)]|nr:hypothetical protein [Syntrophus sp. (in: bacteria)]